MTKLFAPGYCHEDELRQAGFRAAGKNVRISRNCTIIGLENISFGDNVRIDSYCTIIAAGGAEIRFGSFIHVGSYVLLSGGNGIEIKDFSGISHGTKIYSRTDDFSGKCLTGPTVPEKYTNVIKGPVVLDRHVIIGSGVVILPNLTIGEGCSVGALSLVNESLDPWGIYAGIPARRIKDRSRRLLEMEKELRKEFGIV